jgi:hypothetical protein
MRAYTIIFRQPLQPKPAGVPVINSLLSCSGEGFAVRVNLATMAALRR